MITIIGVRFRKSGKVYYFDPTGFTVNKGDHVIVETVRGVEYGSVVLGPKQITDDEVISPLKPLIRVATPKDDEINQENEKKEVDAFDICLEKIAKHGLEMKLIDSEYTFDRNKLLFYFTADGRIDFRELVKDLASVFRTRIELRQIGVRDETKLLGGIAICGRPLCCHSYLSDFAPVSIKMAKEQNLSLNPAKISGVCGRLMCCLKNEQEAYEYLNSTLPSIGTIVKTSDGFQGEVQSVNVLKQLVKIIISKDNDEKEVQEYPVAELTFDNRRKNNGAPVATPLPDETIDAEELEQLQIMEKQDIEDLAEEAAQDTGRPHSGKNNRGQRHPKNHKDGNTNKEHFSGRDTKNKDHFPGKEAKDKERFFGKESGNNNARKRNPSNNYKNTRKAQDYNSSQKKNTKRRHGNEHKSED